MPKISIIIPVYNTEETYLRKCLDSVAEQTSHDLQVILVDDGSKNNAGLICDEYAEILPAFQVLHIENQGVSNARNIGMKDATGEYLMFLDSDDWIETNLCSRLINHLEGGKPDVLVFHYTKVMQEEIIPGTIDLPNHTFSGSELKELQLVILRYSKQYPGINLCTPWCKLYRTDLIKQNGLTFIKGLKRAEDMLFNLNVLEYARDVRFLNETGYYYRLNDFSETQTLTPRITELSKQIRGYLEEFIKNRNKEEVFWEALSAYSTDNIFEQLYMYYGQNKETRKDFYELLKQEPFRSVHKKVKLARLRYKKLSLYTLAARLKLRRIIIFGIYLKNKTALRGRLFTY